MSIFDDNPTKTLYLNDIQTAISASGLGSQERGYAIGYFSAYSQDEKVYGRDIEKILDTFRDQVGDNIESYKADKIRTELERVFTEQNNLS